MTIMRIAWNATCFQQLAGVALEGKQEASAPFVNSLEFFASWFALCLASPSLCFSFVVMVAGLVKSAGSAFVHHCTTSENIPCSPEGFV